jgi:hypothetical protein
MRLVSSKPVVVSRATVSPILTATTLRHDQLLFQRG